MTIPLLVSWRKVNTYKIRVQPILWYRRIHSTNCQGRSNTSLLGSESLSLQLYSLSMIRDRDRSLEISLRAREIVIVTLIPYLLPPYNTREVIQSLSFYFSIDLYSRRL
jgi:hypothetical protein